MKDVLTKSILIIIVALQSCGKEKTSLNNIDLEWTYTMPRFNSTGVGMPAIDKDQLIISSQGETNTSNDIVMALDKASGKLNWEWSDGIPSSNFTTTWKTGKTVIDNGAFYFQDGPRTFSINLEDGQTRWKRLLDPISNTLSTVNGDLDTDGNFIYNGFAPFSNISEGGIIRMDQISGEGAVFYKRRLELDSGVLVTTPVSYVNSSGFRRLLFNEPFFNNVSSNIEGTPSLVSLDAQTGELDYRVILDTGFSTNTTSNQPKIYHNKVIVTTLRKVVCSNADTGEEIWSLDVPGDFLFSDFVVVDGVFYGTYDGDYHTIAIDVDTGSILWRSKVAGSTSIIQYAKGYLYFIGGNTGKLHILDATNGREVYTLDPPNGLSNPFVNVVTDKSSNLMFIQDFTTVYAYSLYQP